GWERKGTIGRRRGRHGCASGARSLASRSVTRLARTGVTPNVLTATGVSLCLAAAVLVPFENRADKLLVYWLAPPGDTRGRRPRRKPRRTHPLRSRGPRPRRPPSTR